MYDPETVPTLHRSLGAYMAYMYFANKTVKFWLRIVSVFNRSSSEILQLLAQMITKYTALVSASSQDHALQTCED